MQSAEEKLENNLHANKTKVLRYGVGINPGISVDCVGHMDKLNIKSIFNIKVVMGKNSLPARNVAVILQCCVVCLFLNSHSLYGNNTLTTRSSVMSMQQHYDAAEHFQGDNDLEQAAFQYQLFLSDALRVIADNRAHIGEYKESVTLFDNALKLTPNDAALQMDYAEAALAAKDFAKTQILAREAINSYPKNLKSADVAHAHSVLGSALWETGDRTESIQQLETAVAIDPTIEHFHALSTEYLTQQDKQDAARLFAVMVKVFGDTAAVHMDIGRSYGVADDPEEAIQEFKKSINEDDRFPEAHYSVGASYLLKAGNVYFPEAKAEFYKELFINPKDSWSYYLLGYIALQQNKLPEAARDLAHSTMLNKQNPDAFLMLGKIYVDMGKTPEAETALRQAIATTTDPSRNHYQIKSAYYQLGHILIQNGNAADGKREIQIAENLLLQNKVLDKENLTGNLLLQSSILKTETVTPADVKTETNAVKYEKQLDPAIADGYNNLGVIAAIDKDYPAAVEYFGQASTWNPAIDGLDKNLGRAFFEAHQYAKSIGPLSHAILEHPDDIQLRMMLGMSQYFVHDYGQVLLALQPVETQVNTVPLLAYMYAESTVQAGNIDVGIHRLTALSQASPSNTLLHHALGKAYTSSGNYQKATEEFRSALRLNPSDGKTKVELAQSLITLGQKTEAQTLLVELAKSGLKNADVYYELGHLQLENGEVKAAMLDLEMAESLGERNAAIHRELANAYRQNLMVQDAEREEKQYQATFSDHAGAVNLSKPN